MSRVTTANRCAQEILVLLADRTVVVICQKAQSHPGQHRGPVTWPLRAVPPPRR